MKPIGQRASPVPFASEKSSNYSAKNCFLTKFYQSIIRMNSDIKLIISQSQLLLGECSQELAWHDWRRFISNVSRNVNETILICGMCDVLLGGQLVKWFQNGNLQLSVLHPVSQVFALCQISNTIHAQFEKYYGNRSPCMNLAFSM